MRIVITVQSEVYQAAHEIFINIDTYFTVYTMLSVFSVVLYVSLDFDNENIIVQYIYFYNHVHK